MVNVNRARTGGYSQPAACSRPEQDDRAGTLLGVLTLSGACAVTFMVLMYAAWITGTIGTALTSEHTHLTKET